jgi:hypothetical protein
MALDTEMSKIAFDLDGVFIPDCDQMPVVGGLQDFLALTVYMRPIFNPKGDWNIITGRPARYRPTTMEWINRHFENKPNMVWHENTLDNEPWIYKAEVINQNDIKLFVESDIKTVEYLCANTKAKIVHFDSFCKLNIS